MTALDVAADHVPPAGGPSGSRPELPDSDVLDEHRLRRTRLSAALCRGTATPRHGVGWPPVVAGVVLTLVVLGGTAVGATVHRHLPRAAFSAPTAGAGPGTHTLAPAARTGARGEGAEPSAPSRDTTSAEDAPRPYVPWLGQTSPQTSR